MADVFKELNAVNVNDHTETKSNGKTNLTYLSWAWAWAEVKKRYPNASYTIVKDDKGLPYFADERCGIMVYTTVTIDGVTHEMWLPVMDGANNAMRFESYTIKTRFGDKTVAPATMFDVNKTVMRCLTKNLAMFGLGLYIYAGEDLPEGVEDEAPKCTTPVEQKPVEKKQTTPAAVSKSQTVTPAEKVQLVPQSPLPTAPAIIKEAMKKNGWTGAQLQGWREALIADGKIDNVPTSTMTPEQAQTFIKTIAENFGA